MAWGFVGQGEGMSLGPMVAHMSKIEGKDMAPCFCEDSLTRQKNSVAEN